MLPENPLPNPLSKRKSRYQTFKEENAQRKAERVKYASTEEIDNSMASADGKSERRSEGKNTGGITNGRNFVGESKRFMKTLIRRIEELKSD